MTGIDGEKWASLGKGRKEKDEETGDEIHVCTECFDAVFDSLVCVVGLV